MKTIFTILFVVLFISNEILSQVVTGILVDENGAGLAEVQLQLYAAPNVYNATSTPVVISKLKVPSELEVAL